MDTKRLQLAVKLSFLVIQTMKYCLTLFTLLILFGLNSCSKGEGNLLDKYRYEVTGTVTAPVHIQYTPDITKAIPDDDDLDDYEVTTTLPWSKAVELHPNVSGAGCSAGTSDAVPGQTINIKIFRDNNLVAEHETVVDADGYAQLLLNYYKDGTVNKY